MNDSVFKKTIKYNDEDEVLVWLTQIFILADKGFARKAWIEYIDGLEE